MDLEAEREVVQREAVVEEPAAPRAEERELVRATGSAPRGKSGSADAGAAPAREEREVVQALLAGDEAVFRAVVSEFQPVLTRLAWTILSDRQLAEEAVQDTWIAVLKGLGGFRFASAFRTWTFSILVRRARTLAARESRRLGERARRSEAGDGWRTAVAPDCGEGSGRAEIPTSAPPIFGPQPHPPDLNPEERLLQAEVLHRAADALRMLPVRQRLVVALRDVEGWSAEEVSNLLGLSPGNQRVLLHRGRMKIRESLRAANPSAGQRGMK